MRTDESESYEIERKKEREREREEKRRSVKIYHLLYFSRRPPEKRMILGDN